MSSNGSRRTILVTGGTGTLGTAVTKSALDDGHRVAATWVVKEEAEALRDFIGGTERLMLVENYWRRNGPWETIGRSGASRGPRGLRM